MALEVSKKPRASVILPAFNGAKTVGRAIENVLGQTFRDFELIIINDGSVDDTELVIKKFQQQDSRIINLKNEKNLGIQRTLNKGAGLARGEYIARIDADDAWTDPDKLQKQVEFMDLNPEHVLLGTGVVVVDEKGQEILRFLNPSTDSEIRRTILARNCFAHPSVLFRKSALVAVGGYDEGQECRHVEDYDLWLRLGKIGKLANLAVYGVRYAQSAAQISMRHKLEQFRKNIRLIKKYRHDYPHAAGALLRAYVRIWLYGHGNMRWIQKITAKMNNRRTAGR